MSNQCTNCSAFECPLSLCSRCKVVKYCTRECQLQHWKAWHKKECRTVVERMKQKIKDYIPNEEIQFKTHEYGRGLQVTFTNRRATMTVLKCNTWDEIKRNIDSKMSNEKSNECSICSTEIQKRTSCNKCAADWCVDCYVSIFRSNKGIIKCPFCRYEFGQVWPDDIIEIGVQEILAKSI